MGGLPSEPEKIMYSSEAEDIAKKYSVLSAGELMQYWSNRNFCLSSYHKSMANAFFTRANELRDLGL